MHFVDTLLALLLLFLLAVTRSRCGIDQKRLLLDLFEVRKYNVLERPVKNDSKALQVSLSFDLQQIITLNERDQYMESSIWITYSWHDAGLIWHPDDYNGISRVRLLPDAVWRPDVLMYNSANEEFDGTWPVNVIVESTGSVSYIPPAMLRSICKVQIRWFPFDEQYCMLKFGSWTYDDKQVNVSLGDPAVIDGNYVANGEWSIVEMLARRYDKEFPYGGVMENYPFVALYFHLQRQPLYYIFNLIMPVALISFMTILVFTLPVDSGEKMALSVTILLSLTVFNMVVAEFVPRTSEALPLLGIYFSCTMFMCSVALVTSVWVLNLYYFPHLVDAPPVWIRYGICVYLARFLRMTIPQELLESAKTREAEQHFRHQQHLQSVQTPLARNGAKGLASCALNNEPAVKADKVDVALFPPASRNKEFIPLLQANVSELRNRNDNLISSSKFTMLNSDGNTRSATEEHINMSPKPSDCEQKDNAGKEPVSRLKMLHDETTCRCCFYMKAIVKELKVLTAKVSDDTKTDLIRIEWRFAARVVDRACFFVFLLVNIICTFVVLFSKPAPKSGAEKPLGWPCEE